MNSKQAFELAQALPQVTIKDHFGRDGFSANKRMFHAFTEIDNAWGRQGWTAVNLRYVEKFDFQKALQSACEYSKVKTAKVAKAPAATKPPKKSKQKSKRRI